MPPAKHVPVKHTPELQATEDSSFKKLGDVALFIDWENLKVSLQKLKDRKPNLSSIIAAAQEYGRLVVARAYADWTAQGMWIDASNLYRAGIDPIYAQGRYENGKPIKNSADVRLAVDTVHTCTQAPNIKTYILVSGDSDLIHSSNFIRQHGHSVIIIAVSDSLSTLLSSAVDEVLIYDIVIDPPRSIEEPAVPKKNITGKHPSKVFDLIREQLVEILTELPPPLPFTALGNKLKTKCGFQASNHGFSFKTIMIEAEKQGLIKIRTDGNMDYALLPGHEFDNTNEDIPLDEREHLAEETVERSNEAGNDLTHTAKRQSSIDSNTATNQVRQVTLEDLPNEDQERFIEFLQDLEGESKYLTRKYVKEHAQNKSILPSLSGDQLHQLINSSIGDGNILTEEIVSGYDSMRDVSYKFGKLHINWYHPTVLSTSRKVMEKSIADNAKGTPE